MEEPENILSLESKEKFRRKILIGSRVIAVFFILSIFWIGFVQVKYVKEVNQIKSEYGPLGYCYLCGLESGRSCSCNYIPELVEADKDFDIKAYLENIANSNINECEDMNNIKLEDLKIK